MFDVQGFILVGGRSRRMGQDKAHLSLGPQTVLARIATELSTAGPVMLVGARQTYGDVSAPNVPDVHPEWGALGGIHAALAAATSSWALVVACDLPFVTRELFGRLISMIGDSTDAIVPIQFDGRPQPVCALYRREQCLPEIEKLIGAGEHTPRTLLANVRTRYVRPEEFKDLRDSENFFLNLNTPEDFAQAQLLTKN